MGCYEQVEFTIESKNICKKPVKQKIKKSKNDAVLLLIRWLLLTQWLLFY